MATVRFSGMYQIQEFWSTHACTTPNGCGSSIPFSSASIPAL